MIEPALEFLCSELKNHAGNILLIADEHLDHNAIFNLKTLPNITVLSNRYDVKVAADASQIPCYFNDMDLSALSTKFQLIAYRISKEKAIVHHIINQAPNHLIHDGHFMMCGFKNEGIKTYISKAEQYLGCKAEISKGERQLKLASFQPDVIGEPLDDKQYQQSICIDECESSQLFSKPGQFGWNKLDQGSELLIESLEPFLSSLAEPPSNVLDLGCGYGYLSVKAAELGLNNITATDNNAAAIASCKKNFSENQINGQVIADDCAQSIEDRFDLVLCNPPFHKGFDTENKLTDLFVGSAKQRLSKSGVALFVVNQFIPLEKAATSYFPSIETLAKNKSFKVIKLSS